MSSCEKEKKKLPVGNYLFLGSSNEKMQKKKIHVYCSQCSGLMMQEFHKSSMDSAVNLRDNFIQSFLMSDQLLSSLKKGKNT